MIRLVDKVPRNVAVAVSGGIDSMVALDFLKRNHNVVVIHVNHGTEWAARAEKFVDDYCAVHNLPIFVCRVQKEPPKGASLEEFWREQRMGFFEYYYDITGTAVVTGHHLDDAVETWVWSALHGNPRLPSVKHEKSGNAWLMRPFLITPKSEIKNWAKRQDIPWVEDPSNADIKFTRNYIRHNLMDAAYKVNPGLRKTIAKKISNK